MNKNKSKGSTWGVVPTKINGLTPKQVKFVQEYSLDWDAQAAARRAGYKTGAIQRILKNPAVAKAVAKAQAEQARLSAVSKEEILGELSTMIRRDILDMCDENGQFYIDSLKQIPPELRRCIDSIDLDEKRNKEGVVVSRRYKITMAKKLEAISMMMKHLGMFAPTEVNMKHGMDWDTLYNGVSGKEEPDPLDLIEGQIEEARESE